LTACRAYYDTGGKLKEGTKIFSGHFLEDVSDHLANYTIICNMKSHTKPERPLVRIFSQKNKQKFTDYLLIISIMYFLIMMPTLPV